MKKDIIASEKMRNSNKYIYIYMIMLTRSSERIFNPSRYTRLHYCMSLVIYNVK